MNEELAAYGKSIDEWVQQKLTGKSLSNEEFYKSMLRKYEQELTEEKLSREELDNYWINRFLNTLAGFQYRHDKALTKKNVLYKKVKAFFLESKKVWPLPLAFVSLIESRHKDVVKHIKLFFEREGSTLTCDELSYHFLVFLKDGFPGMWTEIGDMTAKTSSQTGLPEMCYALETVYYSKDSDEIIDALSKVIMTNNNVYIAHELLGYTYYNAKMWKNAISCFEHFLSIENAVTIFGTDMLYHWLAWSYGATKQYKEEERCYRKSMEQYHGTWDALNNLGYSLYKQKRYGEAQLIFQQCIDEKRDLKYAANNMLRVLLAQKQFNKALEFIENCDGRLSSALIRQTEEKQKKYKDVPDAELITEDIFVEDVIEEAEEPPKEIRLGASRQQFSSEKLLEDELVLRLEKGSDVFGVPLWIYEQKGAYGRQFIIPIGRIDILAVDAHGNLYIIEVKKDAGYGDTYAQISRYIEWFETNMAGKGKSVYGILCLNSPNPALVDKVRANAKVRLFEYKISYLEVK